jgi:hypothetical protein
MMRIPKVTPYRAGSMIAFLSVQTSSGMILHDLRLMTGHDGFWIALPSKLLVDADGQPRTDLAGKKQYAPLIEFHDAKVAANFKRQVLDAVRREHPELLDIDGSGGMTTRVPSVATIPAVTAACCAAAKAAAAQKSTPPRR